MKKVIMLFFLVFSSIMLVACGEQTTLEWVTMPQSVYEQASEAVMPTKRADFMQSVKVKINGVEYSLEAAVGQGATVTGFDLVTTGEKLITVKYETLTIYWSYRVGVQTSNVIDPDITWYTSNPGAVEFTLSDEADLYGLAQLVNEGYGESKVKVNFAGKTVKLNKDMDLSDKVWVPIGQGVRKDVMQIEADSDMQSDVLAALNAGFDDNTDYEDITNRYYFIKSGYYVRVSKDLTLPTSNFDASKMEVFHADRAVDGTFFEGTFDGRGYKIIGLSDIGYTPLVTNVYASSSRVLRSYVFGLFGIVQGNVTIKNVNFENVSIVGAFYEQGNIVSAYIDSVGSAVGYVNEVDGNFTVDNVKVLSGSITARAAAGGIVGRVYAQTSITIKNSENRANIVAEENHAGGIVGYVYVNKGSQTYLNNTNYGNVTCLDSNTVGGIGNMTNPKSLVGNRNYGNIYRGGSTAAAYIPGYNGFGLIADTGTSFITDHLNANYGNVYQNGVLIN